MELPLEHADLVAQHHQLDVLVHTGTGSPRSEPRPEVLELPRTKRRRPTLNAFSAIEVLVPYSSVGSTVTADGRGADQLLL